MKPDEEKALKPGQVEVHVIPSVTPDGRILLTLSGEIHGTLHLGSVESLQVAKQVLWAAGYVVSAAAPVPVPVPAPVPVPVPDENC